MVNIGAKIISCNGKCFYKTKGSIVYLLVLLLKIGIPVFYLLMLQFMANEEHIHTLTKKSIVLSILCFTSVVFYLIMAFTDPGIIPKETETLTAYANDQLIEINGILYLSKYCTVCNIRRPPRSHHCSTCGVCIKGFDHHCGFINGCVGARNRRYYILY